MSKKVRSYSNYKEVVDFKGVKHTVLVYGEVAEYNHIYGYAPVVFSCKGCEVMGVANPIVDDSSVLRSPVKQFNMGYSICHSHDEFNIGRGINLAKKRFSLSPMTTQNGSFLNPDMVKVIVDNELDYIAEHIEEFMINASRK